jgi:nucleotide-binding universal stress UspA family protein
MHILCGIDESDHRHAVAHGAAQLARRMGAELTLTNVTAAGARELDALADDSAARFDSRPDVRVAQSDNAAAWLPVTARDLASDLVVVGASRRGRLAGARTARAHIALVAQLGRPVIVVPADAEPLSGRRVAVAYEGSEISADAAAVAGQLATAIDGDLTAIHVLADPRSVARPVLAMQRDVAADVEAGVDGEALDLRHVSAYRLPADHLGQTVADVDPALLVVAAPRAGWRNPLRPSLSAQLVRRASCPVVLVPRGAALRAREAMVAMAA